MIRIFLLTALVWCSGYLCGMFITYKQQVQDKHWKNIFGRCIDPFDDFFCDTAPLRLYLSYHGECLAHNYVPEYADKPYWK